MTTKKEQIRKQTWKFFWQQKIQEVGVFLGIALSIIFIPLWVGRWEWATSLISNDIPLTYVWWTGLVALIFGLLSIGMVLLSLFLFGMVMKDWLESNWKRAEKRAKKKYKTKRTSNK